MKNKNNVINRSVTELVNKIVELQDRKGNGRYAHSYALGTLQSIINGELNGWNSDGLQEAINDSFNSVQNELNAFTKGVHALQST
jgi:superoxide dismutase